MSSKRLYQCEDCKNRQFVSRIELSRRAKPKCTKCGCSRLEMVSDEAVIEMADINTARLVQESIAERKRSGSRGAKTLNYQQKSLPRVWRT